jgi:hypothetical protein
VPQAEKHHLSKYRIACLMLALCWAAPAAAHVSIGIGLPIVNIEINLPLFPQLVPVPGYPVYYAPEVNTNHFFYDGPYWVYRGNVWYASSWYNGPLGIDGDLAMQRTLELQSEGAALQSAADDVAAPPTVFEAILKCAA